MHMQNREVQTHMYMYMYIVYVNISDEAEGGKRLIFVRKELISTTNRMPPVPIMVCGWACRTSYSRNFKDLDMIRLHTMYKCTCIYMENHVYTWKIMCMHSTLAINRRKKKQILSCNGLQKLKRYMA